jgi:hypothetical protein
VLEELTRGVGLFLPLSVRRGQSTCAWPTVREVPVQPSSSRVCRVLARLRFRSGFVLGFRCSRFADGLSFSSGRFGSGANGPPGPHGQSIFPGSSLVVLLAFTNCPRLMAGLSAAPGWTVRGSWPDCPRGLCGQSAPPGRTVRQCLAALLLGSIPPSFLSYFRVCFKESFLRLEVVP